MCQAWCSGCQVVQTKMMNDVYTKGPDGQVELPKKPMVMRKGKVLCGWKSPKMAVWPSFLRKSSPESTMTGTSLGAKADSGWNGTDIIPTFLPVVRLPHGAPAPTGHRICGGLYSHVSPALAYPCFCHSLDLANTDPLLRLRRSRR